MTHNKLTTMKINKMETLKILSTSLNDIDVHAKEYKAIHQYYVERSKKNVIDYSYMNEKPSIVAITTNKEKKH